MAVHFRVPAIVWTSDLHLDHASAPVRNRLAKNLGAAAGQALVVTGDISIGSALVADLEFLADAVNRPLYFVLGNHDHYGANVAAVRDAVLELGTRRPAIQWLPPAGVVPLDADTALVGVDGWADGRQGDALTTRFVLNDDRLIGELAIPQTRAGKLLVKRALADADGDRLGVLLERAVAVARRIVIATHVPPFAEALPPAGRLAHPEWRPLLICSATGDVIRRAAENNPGHTFTVLCGHTHAAADVQVAANLRCVVAGARYGEPGVRTIEV
jgi:hypothetical protein